jgi:hypothetical protein
MEFCCLSFTKGVKIVYSRRMPKTFRTSWVFLPLSLICGLLYLHTPQESLILGLLYGAALSLRLPKEISPREIFPLLMLFLFLMVLAETPQRSFTFSLAYTTRALILFRGLIVTLARIQTSKAPTERSQATWALGLTLELFVTAIFVYSTFRPANPEILAVGSHLFGSTLMVFASLFTPFMIPGLILAAFSFSPMLHIWSMIGFGLLAVYESNFSQRARSAAPRILS